MGTANKPRGTQKKHKNHRLRVEIDINGVPVNTLIDTGAEVTIMDEKIFN